MNDNDVQQLVRDQYGQETRRVLSGTAPSRTGDAVPSDLSGRADATAVPAEALEASLGCGNPAALTQLKPGEVVLDLGSGGGSDVLLSARRVGPSGKAYGLDMTDEMLTPAEENKAGSGLANVEFLRGRSRTSRSRTPRST
jgi:SAM-dependent methyltransferase